MQIGVPKEIKNNEFRVGLTPASAAELIANNHSVFVERNAGKEIGFSDNDYSLAGANILETAAEVFNAAELIIKVKEPMQEELQFLSDRHTLFTYLHLAGDRKHAADLIKTGVTGIAYETVTSANGSLPLLAPMSAIAGQLSIVVGSYHLLKPNKGRGTLEKLIQELLLLLEQGLLALKPLKKQLETTLTLKLLIYPKRDWLS